MFHRPILQRSILPVWLVQGAVVSFLLVVLACGAPHSDTDDSPPGHETGNGETGNGETGNGETGNGETGNGETGNGETGNGETGNGETGNEVDPYADRPLGQCTENADCPEGPQGRSCNRDAPGGICLACGSDLHCPSLTTCTQFGSCSHTCTDGDDCPPGMRCAGNGLCALKPCENGVCSVPFLGCSESNYCTRVACPTGDECPDETTCLAGVCIEDRVL